MKTLNVNSPSEKKYKCWKKSVETNGEEKSIEVKEAENGFVITQISSSYDPWKRDEKIYISTKNPLEKEEGTEVIEDKKVMDAIDEFNKVFK